MKLSWLTDIHLNFLEPAARQNFYRELSETNSDAILITGDIAEASSVIFLLKEMAAHLQRPIYFVLGNHDYYRGNVDDVRVEMIALTQSEPLLHWLPASKSVQLSSKTVLVGQDGWADGRYGDYQNSAVVLNDSIFIADLFQQKLLGRSQLLKKMQALADTDAQHLQNNIETAITRHHPEQLIVLTHVPPFPEACQYQGKMSSKDWLPYYSSKATGNVLLAAAAHYLDVQFLVLCGHTHSEAYYQPLNNVTVRVGRAEYYQPCIQAFTITG